jgi:hypothetical protein
MLGLVRAAQRVILPLRPFTYEHSLTPYWYGTSGHRCWSPVVAYRSDLLGLLAKCQAALYESHFRFFPTPQEAVPIVLLDKSHVFPADSKFAEWNARNSGRHETRSPGCPCLPLQRRIVGPRQDCRELHPASVLDMIASLRSEGRNHCRLKSTRSSLHLLLSLNIEEEHERGATAIL